MVKTILFLILTVLLFGMLIAIHEFGHFIVSKMFGIRVREFSIGMGKRTLWKYQGKETLYAIRPLPFGGYCDIGDDDPTATDERSFNGVSPLKKILILGAGCFNNIVCGYILLFICLSLSNTYISSTIDNVSINSPAYEFGLMAGDTLVSINGTEINEFKPVITDKEFNDIVIKRNDEIITYENVSLKAGSYVDENGVLQENSFGISLEVKEYSFTQTFKRTWENSIELIKTLFESLRMLISGEVSSNEMSGIIGTVGYISETSANQTNMQSSFVTFFLLGAFIALNLGIFNLLPIPAMDGGRILFIIIDLIYAAIMKKHISAETEAKINKAGYSVLMGFMVILVVLDIVHMF